MKIGSFQGIPLAYFIKNGYQELQAQKRIKNIDKQYSNSAVNITISGEAKALYAASQPNASPGIPRLTSSLEIPKPVEEMKPDVADELIKLMKLKAL